MKDEKEKERKRITFKKMIPFIILVIVLVDFDQIIEGIDDAIKGEYHHDCKQ